MAGWSDGRTQGLPPCRGADKELGEPHIQPQQASVYGSNATHSCRRRRQGFFRGEGAVAAGGGANRNNPEAAIYGKVASSISTWGGDSGFTVIYGVAAPVKAPPHGAGARKLRSLPPTGITDHRRE